MNRNSRYVCCLICKIMQLHICFFDRTLRAKQASKIHMNLFLSLIAFYVTFLAGERSSHNPIHCRNLASAVHYFALTSVCWMSVEAVNMYLLFVKYERSNIRHFVPIACVMAYGKRDLFLCFIVFVVFLRLGAEVVGGSSSDVRGFKS